MSQVPLSPAAPTESPASPNGALVRDAEVAGHNVALVSWPMEAAVRAKLVRDGTPRLLLLAQGALPPGPADCLEDWVRLPASEDELAARVRALGIRGLHHRRNIPTVDETGVLRIGDRTAYLPPVEARLVAALVERFGSVVGRSTLFRAGWPEGPPSPNTLEVHVLRLRRRLADVGLGVRTIRQRGYLLHELSADQFPGG